MQSPERTLSTRNIILLSVLMVIGAILRFYALGSQSLWTDELASWRQSNYAQLSSVIMQGVRPDTYPPGHHILLYFLQRYVGDSEAILRFPSAVSGVLCIPVIFLLGNLLYSRREGILAAALMTVLWFPIYYSQEARSYSLLLLFTMIATYFWICIVRSLREESGPSIHSMCAYIISSLISSYLHYFGLFLVALQGIGAALLFFHPKRSLFRIAAVYSLIIIGYLPWLPFVPEQFGHQAASVQATTKGFLVKYVATIFNVNEKGLLGYFILTGVLILYFYVAFVIIRDVIRTKAYRDIRGMLLSSELLVISYLLVPLMIAYGISLFSKAPLAYRYLIISLPAAYLLFSRSVTKLPLGTRNQGFMAIGIIAFFLLHLVFGLNYYSEPQKEQFREIVRLVASEDKRFNNSLIIGNSFYNAEFFNYYFRRIGSTRRVDVAAWREKDIAHVAEMIRIRNPRYIWFISGHRMPEVEFVEFLNTHFRRIYWKEFSGGTSDQCPGGKPCVHASLFENELSNSEFLR